jgi:hypothetical protein
MQYYPVALKVHLLLSHLTQLFKTSSNSHNCTNTSKWLLLLTAATSGIPENPKFDFGFSGMIFYICV